MRGTIGAMSQFIITLAAVIIFMFSIIFVKTNVN